MLKESGGRQSSSEMQRQLSQEQVNPAAHTYADMCKEIHLKSVYNSQYFIYMLPIWNKLLITQHSLQPQNKTNPNY